jgi:hypothetical protein
VAQGAWADLGAATADADDVAVGQEIGHPVDLQLPHSGTVIGRQGARPAAV